METLSAFHGSLNQDLNIGECLFVYAFTAPAGGFVAFVTNAV